jgi:UPF0042 nucleotide-binding protein
VAEYLVVTGMSGAGRSSAAATLEDVGWFVIDNLPPSLLGRIAELANRGESELDQFCFVVGRGGVESIAALAPAVAELRATGARVRVLFLDCSDEVLVRRYEGTRRRHPLEADGVLDAIRTERELLSDIKNDADVVIDTSEVNSNELRARLAPLFARGSGTEAGTMETSVVSFGFKYGLPLDVDLVLDCRFLPNPHWVDELRPKTGLDPAVREFVLNNPESEEFVRRVDDLLSFLLPAYAKEGKSYLSIAIGCTGGHHRSVALAEEFARRLTERGFAPAVHHRDVER